MKIEWDMRHFKTFAEELRRQKDFEVAIKNATKKLAKTLHRIIIRNTPVNTGQLQAGWNTGANLTYRVTKVSGGYQVVLTNNVEYAYWVNYGHHSYNQFGGPYVVKRRTVKYTRGNNGKTFVYGHFFVEHSMTEMEITNQIEKAIMPYLRTWWEGCFK